MLGKSELILIWCRYKMDTCRNNKQIKENRAKLNNDTENF